MPSVSGEICWAPGPFLPSCHFSLLLQGPNKLVWICSWPQQPNPWGINGDTFFSCRGTGSHGQPKTHLLRGENMPCSLGMQEGSFTQGVCNLAWQPSSTFVYWVVAVCHALRSAGEWGVRDQDEYAMISAPKGIIVSWGREIHKGSRFLFHSYSNL